MKFLEGSPPKEVTDKSTFDFQAVVSIKNIGIIFEAENLLFFPDKLF